MGELISRYIDSPIKYFKRTDLRFHERFVYCFLCWIQKTAFLFGYLSCPDLKKSFD